MAFFRKTIKALTLGGWARGRQGAAGARSGFDARPAATAVAAPPDETPFDETPGDETPFELAHALLPVMAEVEPAGRGPAREGMEAAIDDLLGRTGGVESDATGVFAAPDGAAVERAAPPAQTPAVAGLAAACPESEPEPSAAAPGAAPLDAEDVPAVAGVLAFPEGFPFLARYDPPQVDEASGPAGAGDETAPAGLEVPESAESSPVLVEVTSTMGIATVTVVQAAEPIFARGTRPSGASIDNATPAETETTATLAETSAATLTATTPPALGVEAVESAGAAVGLIGTNDESATAAPAASALSPEARAETKADSAPAGPAEIDVDPDFARRASRDPIVDDLLMALLSDARRRADSAVKAYETLGRSAAEYAARSRRNARSAWGMVGALAATLLVGGITGTYEIVRAWGEGDVLRGKVQANASAVSKANTLAAADRAELQREIAVAGRAHAQTVAQLEADLKSADQAKLQAEIEVKIARQARARAEDELKIWQRQLGAEARTDAGPILHPSAAPAARQSLIPPGNRQATAAPTGDEWASLLNGK